MPRKATPTPPAMRSEERPPVTLRAFPQEHEVVLASEDKDNCRLCAAPLYRGERVFRTGDGPPRCSAAW